MSQSLSSWLGELSASQRKILEQFSLRFCMFRQKQVHCGALISSKGPVPNLVSIGEFLLVALVRLQEAVAVGGSHSGWSTSTQALRT